MARFLEVLPDAIARLRENEGPRGGGYGVARTPEKRIDLRGTPCPLNWVKTKLRLEEMQPGTRLEVLVDDGAPGAECPTQRAGRGTCDPGVGPGT